jgi:hypothetical protein
MSSIVTITGVIPSNGNPDGIVPATKGALFYKSGSLYKINYEGMSSSSWQSVYFNPFRKQPPFITQSDWDSIPVPETESYLYVKEVADSTSVGWKYLSNKGPFISSNI